MPWKLKKETVTAWSTRSGKNLLLPHVAGASVGGMQVCTPLSDTDSGECLYSTKAGVIGFDKNTNITSARGKKEGGINKHLCCDLTYGTPHQHQLSIYTGSTDKFSPRNEDGHRALHWHKFNHRMTVYAKEAMSHSVGLMSYFQTDTHDFFADIDGFEFNALNVSLPVLLPIPKTSTPVLELDHGKISLTSIRGYSHICVWSDQPRKYVGIGLVDISSTDEPIHLAAEEQITYTCVFVYVPNRTF